MATEKNIQEFLIQYASDCGSLGLPEVSDRDIGLSLLLHLDYEAQLLAVRSLLKCHADRDKALSEEIHRIEELARHDEGLCSQQIVDEWVDSLNCSVYQDAAHSMAAVGMLAPLMESIFCQAFQGIRARLSDNVIPDRNHKRWQQSAEDQWNCHLFWSSGARSKNLVEGILQLAEAVELLPYLPNNLKQTLQALFEYRNRMFHCGFEWPVEERKRFAERIDKSGWPDDWFSKATSDREPWIFYLTDTFISHCLDTIDQIVVGLGAFERERLDR